MNEVAEQAQPPKLPKEDAQLENALAREATSVLEQLSKFAALMFACIYAFGFMIVSLSDAQYGVLQFNLLKPRIFAAGALFILLVAIPSFAIRRVLRRCPIPEGAASWYKEAFNVNRYFNMCMILAAASYGVLWLQADWRAVFDKEIPHPHLRAIAFALWFLSSGRLARFTRRHKTDPQESSVLPFVDFALANILVLYVLR